jgi:hypothetical protein
MLSVGSVANAQWDPEGGDNWQAPPPDQTQQQQQQQQQPPPDQQQQGWQQQQTQQTQTQQTQTQQEEQPPGWGQGGEETPPASERPAAGGDDHATNAVGHLAVTWLGLQTVAFPGDTLAVPGMPTPGTPAGPPIAALNLPTIGIRYWLSEMVGLDIGLGFHFSTGAHDGEDLRVPGSYTPVDDPQTTAFMLHGGLPLALYHDGHYKFVLIPELDLGFATGNNGASKNLTGFTFRVGARIGSEIHFGFMGIPQLALQATVGLHLQYDSASTDDCPTGDCGASNVVTSANLFRIRTLEFEEPWNIIAGNIAALYYF